MKSTTAEAKSDQCVSDASDGKTNQNGRALNNGVGKEFLLSLFFCSFALLTVWLPSCVLSY